jgi:Spy/CpxP family protein refolding chaperone
MKRLYVTALCSVIAAGLVMSAGCGKKARFDTDKDHHGDIKARITEIKRHVMAKTMDLDEATINKVIDVTNGYDERKIALFKERRTNLDALRTTLKSDKTTDAEVKPLIDALNKNDEALFQLRQEEQTELATILTTQQLGRYMLFEEKFKHAVRKRIESRRDNRHHSWKWWDRDDHRRG